MISIKRLRTLLLTVVLLGTFFFVVAGLTDNRSVTNLELQSSTAGLSDLLPSWSNQPTFKRPSKAIMSKMGRSAWHLLHTMSVKFPLEPSNQEQQAYLDFVRLFSQLYPCGECASHFQSLLARHPPRTSSRHEVVQWTCEVHNMVNERLEKPIVNCTGIEELWKCGCAEEGEELETSVPIDP
ncbi:hypothetical protein HDV02_005869 [Globomyces sp. JEL0801]|nr:hypothetical protein HDV02_005869 [Globomyces sp. JEL0801]